MSQGQDTNLSQKTLEWVNETRRINLLSARVEKRRTAMAGIFPENLYNYKCFGIFVNTNTKNRTEFDSFPQKTQKLVWTKLLATST